MKTVLLITRHRRLHATKLLMARELAAEARVVVLAIPALAADFEAIPEVVVLHHRSPDVLRDGEPVPEVPLDVLRARTAAIEAELGMSLYKAAGNFLLYGRVVRQFGGHWDYLVNEQDIFGSFVHAYDQLTEIFEQYAPDVVFYETVDLISNYVALALSAKRNVFAFEPRPSPIGHGLGSVAYGIDRRNLVLEHLLANPREIAEKSLAMADDYLANPRENLYKTFWSETHREMVGGLSPFNPRWWSDRVRSRKHLVHGARNARWHLNGIRNRKWLDGHLARALPKERYVAFLLNHVPEASTCSQAPRWIDQDAIVEQLAINAPSNLKIVVKEHPRTYGRRGESFFGPLLRLPNVVVCHPSVENFSLLTGAEAVLTVTGTAGFEGIVLGKRVGVLGRPYYSVYPGVRRLDHPEELFEHLADPGWSDAASAEERRRFLAAYMQSLFEYGAGEGTRFFPPAAGPGWARALMATLAFVDAHELRPNDFEPAPRLTPSWR